MNFFVADRFFCEISPCLNRSSPGAGTFSVNTTLETPQCGVSTEIADTELNEVYNKILKEYKSDKVFICSLKESQNLWIKYRDAEEGDVCAGSLKKQ